MEQKLQNLKRWEQENHKKILIIAVTVFVAAAFAFFMLNGRSSTITESSAKAGTEVQEETVGSSNGDAQTDGASESGENASKFYVDIDGAVVNPGVYRVKSGARLFEVIDMAGGLTKKADTQSLNMAAQVTDGQKVFIAEKADSGSGTGQNSAGGQGGSAAGATGSSQNTALVNINQADVIELQAINGVGPVTAESIVKYREENGPFQKKEDLKNVSGIGDKTFEKLENQITV